VNLPNSITLIRIFSIPLLMWILSSARFSSVHGQKELLASIVFIAAAMTDGIDGYLARKHQQITTMGILLDPLADKLLIAAAFVTLVQLNPSLVPAWIAVVVIGREFLVSGLRSIAASEGFDRSQRTRQADDGRADRLCGRRYPRPSLERVANLRSLLLPCPLDRLSGDLVHGVRVAGFCRGLFCRFLVED
jgi:phosphatidylglycerophosphate synthase